MRLFPATAYQRLAALLAMVTLVAAVSVTSLAQADSKHAATKHLRQQQARAQHSVTRARASLDEASTQTRHAFRALTRSRAALRSAKHDLKTARTGLNVRADGPTRFKVSSTEPAGGSHEPGPTSLAENKP